MPSLGKVALDHFYHPRNAGELSGADGIGEEGTPGDGPFMRIFVRIEAGAVAEASFLTYGCAAAIASCSLLTETVKGMAVDEAKEVTAEELAEALGGLPLGKRHCPRMAVAALGKALDRRR